MDDDDADEDGDYLDDYEDDDGGRHMSVFG